MQRVRRTAVEKAAALELLATVGLGEAARRTGIPQGTIASWGSRSSVRAPAAEVTAVAVAAHIVAWEEKRTAVANKLGTVADRAADRLLEKLEAGEITVAQLISILEAATGKAQLLTGGSTSRDETVTTGQAQLLQEAAERARHLRSA